MAKAKRRKSASKPKKTYTPARKESLLRRYQAHKESMSAHQAALKVKVPYTTLVKWERNSGAPRTTKRATRKTKPVVHQTIRTFEPEPLEIRGGGKEVANFLHQLAKNFGHESV